MNGTQENQSLQSAQNANLHIGTKKKLTQERLKDLLNYNPDTGIFKWKKSTNGRIEIGQIAGCIHHTGYSNIKIDKKKYNAHRLAWLYVYGYFPEHEIDHINRNRSDNRLKNLREVSRQCNLRNSDKRKNNTSGITGVVWNKKSQKWQAQMRINRNTIHCGYYDTFDDAVAARHAAEVEHNWPGCNSCTPAYQHIYGI
jgi:citrate synthase